MPGPSPLRTRPKYPKYPKKRQPSHSEEDNDEEEQEERSRLPDRLLQPVVSLGRPYESDEEKKQVYIDLIRLKASGKSNKEAAEILGVSPRTVDNYRADAYYAELEKDLESEAKQRGYHVIGELISDSLEVMYDILHHGKSEFVRFKAAETLLNYAGYGIPRETAVTSSREEATKFLEEVKKRSRVQVNVQINHMPGGETKVEMVESTVEGVQPKGDVLAIPEELAPYYQPILPGGKLPESFQRKVEES